MLVSDFGLDGTGRFSLSWQGTSQMLSCGTPLACGAATTATTFLRAKTVAYRFAASDGDAVTIGVAREATSGGSFKPIWELRDPSGGLVASSFGSYTADLTGHGTGTYTILAWDFGLDGTGTLSLSWQGSSEGLTCGTPIACGETKTGETTLFAQTFAYTFAGNDGDGVTISIAEILETRGSFTPIWELRDPSGGFVASSFGTFSADLTGHGTGTYTILVEDFGLDGTGRFSLSFQGSGCMTSVVCGDPVEDEIGSLSGMAAYGFDVPHGERVTIRVEAVESFDGEFEPAWELQNSAGRPLSRGSGTATVELPGHVPGWPDRYRLVVFANESQGTGRFRFVLAGGSACDPPDPGLDPAE